MTSVLEIEDLTRSFHAPDGSGRLVFRIDRFCVQERAELAIRGESGSGKTTFLNLIAGILRPDSGRIRIAGTDLEALTESERDRLRAEMIGYVFQTFNLLQGYTALENVLIASMFGRGEDAARAASLLKRVGLEDRLNYLPSQLSVGQQQRVAVARALVNAPRLLLADEPTGNLDPANSREVLKLLRTVCVEEGAALLLVSHDQGVLGTFGQILDLSSFAQLEKAR